MHSKMKFSRCIFGVVVTIFTTIYLYILIQINNQTNLSVCPSDEFTFPNRIVSYFNWTKYTQTQFDETYFLSLKSRDISNVHWPFEVPERNITYYQEISNSPWIDNNHNLLYCFIPKNSCSKFKSLFYSINHLHATASKGGVYWKTERFIRTHQPGHEHLYPTISNQSHYLSILHDITYKKFVILRDPLQRLLSAFMHTCVIKKHTLYQIENNVSCKGIFYDYFHDFVVHKHFNLSQFHHQIQINITLQLDLFETFVNALYETSIVHKQPKSQVDGHYHPQSYMCQLHTYIHHYDYIILYDKDSRVMNKMAKFLLQQIFENEYEIDLLLNHWGYYQNQTMFDTFSEHSTTQNESAMNHHLSFFYGTRDVILRKALEIYDIDYKLLPIHKPKWIQDIMTKSKVNGAN
eukprot:126246_1